MSTDIEKSLPKLRNIEATPVTQAGQHYFLLNDPLRLSEKQIIIPQALGVFLQLCDGTRDASGLSAALAVRYGQSVSPSEIEGLLTALNDIGQPPFERLSWQVFPILPMNKRLETFSIATWTR
jgi:hypothetical protein